MTDRTKTVSIDRRRGDSEEHVRDLVAAEEPLEIRVGTSPLAVVMRTPGDDEDLAAGFFLTEGILQGPHEIAEFEHPSDSQIAVRLAKGVEVDPARFQRNMFVSSSCGVCGKASIESVQIFARPASEFRIGRRTLAALTDRLRRDQPTFDTTGGLHAAGLFDVHGEPLAVREDVGRHNAADKAIGAVARERWPLPPCVLVVSGRQSFEIVQKAAVAGVGGVVGVSAPSSLAVKLAASLGMLLVGFSRGDGYNVYAGAAHVSD